MMRKNKLVFFITIKKATKEIVLQEGNLISLKIPQHWQKADSNVKNPALWVCHLPTNSLGIKFISLYPSELIIKKEKWSKEAVEWEEENDLEEITSEQGLITYRGKLQPNGANDEEEFYRCEMVKIVKKAVVQDDGTSSLAVFLVLIFIIVIILLVLSQANR